MDRRVLGTVGFAILFGIAAVIVFAGGVPISDYYPSIVGALIGASLLAIGWGFKPNIDRAAKPKRRIHAEAGAGTGLKAIPITWADKLAKIVQVAIVGFGGGVVLIYVGLAAYAVLPSSVAPSAFLTVITAIALGIVLLIFAAIEVVTIIRE